MRWVSKVILAFLLIISTTVLSLSQGVPEVLADDPTDLFYLRNETSNVVTATTCWQYNEQSDGDSSISTSVNGKSLDGSYVFVPGTTNATAGTPGTITNTGWIWDTPFQQGGYIQENPWTFYFSVNTTSGDAGYVCHLDVVIFKVTVSGGSIIDSSLVYNSNDDGSWPISTDFCDAALHETNYSTSSISQIEFAANEYLYIEYWMHVTTKAPGKTFDADFGTGPSYSDPRVDMPTIRIPEKVVFLVAFAPFIPMIVLWLRQRRGLKLISSADRRGLR